MDTPSPPSASSPCIRVCVIDEGSGLCDGCGRTLGEIAAWGSMSEAARRLVIADIDRRGWRAGSEARPVGG